MAQVARQLRKAMLLALPAAARARVLHRWPNFRKAAPAGMSFVFDHYLGSIRVHVDTRFKVERIMWSGVFEPPLQQFIREHIRPGDVCLDVGANVGAITLGLAAQVGPTGRVIALEPAPLNFHRLTANLALNPGLGSSVTCLNSGAAAAPGRLFWNEEPGNPGNGSLRDSGSIPVSVTTIDDTVTGLGLERVDFMKVDVEGMELAVFEGAQATLDRFRPRLYFETLRRFSDAGGVDNFDRIAAFLGRFGYRLYHTAARGLLVENRPGRFADYTVATVPRPSQPRNLPLPATPVFP